MIQKLQRLKAKKGFTLVELIVVIAIIGVLAAILIPTMLGYVTSSRVASACQTAASIKNNIDSWLTEMDTRSAGMLKGVKQTANIDISVSTTGGVTTWTVTSTTTDAQWQSEAATKVSGTGTYAGGTMSGKAVLSSLAKKLGDLFPDLKTASAAAYLQGGKCIAVKFTTDATTLVAAAAGADTTPTIVWDATAANGIGSNQFDGTTSFTWEKTEGISASGWIVGTAPEVKNSLGS